MNGRGNDWRDLPILGKDPPHMVLELLLQLLERVREVGDLPKAIEKLQPTDPRVFERAWVNELFVLINGVKWMFEIVEIVYEREATATGQPAKDISPSLKEAIQKLETELKPARDKLVAHYFDLLRGHLTVRDYFQADVQQHTLKYAHAVIETTIRKLMDWHREHGHLIEKHLNAKDVKGKRRRKRKR